MITFAIPTTIDFFVTAKGCLMPMEEPAKLPSFAKCASCGKLTFIDLLDEAMMCEYCRELRRIPPKPSRGKKAKAKK